MPGPNNVERLEEIEIPSGSVPVQEDASHRGRARLQIRPLVNRSLPYLFAVVCLSEALAAGSVANSFGVFDGAKKWFTSISNPAPTGTVFPVDQEGKRLDFYDTGLQPIVEKQLDVYREFQIYSQISLESLLEKPQPQETIDTLHRMARNNLISSINLIDIGRLTGYIQDRADMDSSYQVLRINSQTYDLNDKFQLQLANAWIEVKLNYLDAKIRLNKGNALPENKARIESQAVAYDEEAKLLEWFRSISPQVNLGQDSFAFFPEWQMESMARIFKAVNDQGYVLPREVNFCGTGCLKEKNAIGLAHINQNTTEIENRAGSFVVAHEIAHLISAQRDLMQHFTEIRGISGADVVQNRLKYVSDYSMTSSIEDFAETFAEYVINGDKFRFKLDQLSVHKPNEYKDLKRKYDFFKEQVFNSIEFSSMAKARNLETEKAEEDFHGIRILPEEGNTVIVQPNPKAHPEKNTSYLIIPALKDDKFVDIIIYFSIGQSFAGHNSYNFRIISGTEEIQSLFLYPYQGDLSVRIEYGFGSTKIATPFIEVPIKEYLKREGKQLPDLAVESLAD